MNVHKKLINLLQGPVSGSAIPGFFVYEDKFATPEASPHSLHPLVVIAPSPSATSPEARDISKGLLAEYPSDAYFNVLVDDSFVFLKTYQSMFHSYCRIEEWMVLLEKERPDYHLLHTRHTCESHPVVIAEQMLILANILQQAGSDALAKLKTISNQPPKAVMARLATAAITVVTANDHMLDTSEGLTCLILDSIYKANQGHLRQAWIAHRRIVGIAQAIGIHRRPYRALSIKSIQCTCILDPRFLWHRILHVDRVLSLMLGLPPAALDLSMVAEPAFSQDTPMGQLERRHAVAAARILERNEREPDPEDFDLTHSIDADLQRAANNMPGRWWLEPTWTASLSGAQRFRESRRMINQICHYYLLHQLHLPYMIIGSVASSDQSRYDYSRNTCISASRDILARCLNNFGDDGFLVHCRLLDYLALMSALTLLVMHLYIRHHGTSPCLLAHQRLSDRAMIEQVLEALEKATPTESRESGNAAAKMTKQLLAIDANLESRPSNFSPGSSAVTPSPSEAEGIRFFVPCFGIVGISRDGNITTERINPGDITSSFPQSQSRTYDRIGREPSGHEVRTPADTLPMHPVDGDYAPEANFLLPTEDANHPALQVVDFVFFDSLMRESYAQMGDSMTGHF